MLFVNVFFLGASLIATIVIGAIVVYRLWADRWEARAPLVRELLPHKKEENAED